MKYQRPIRHALDHLPGGADPLPWPTTPPVPPPGTPPKTYPPPPPKPADTRTDWHWWRFPAGSGPTGNYGITPPGRYIPDEAGNQFITPVAKMPMDPRTTGHVAWTEWNGGQPGPNADSQSMYRKCGVETIGGGFVSFANPHNWLQAIVLMTDTIEFGHGGLFSIVGWFKLDKVNDYELFHLYGGSGGADTFVAAAGDRVYVSREGNIFFTPGGVIGAGSWFYWAIVVAGGRLKFYINPGAPEPTAASPTLGTNFPFDMPIMEETWGLAQDYGADQLAQRCIDNGFRTVSVQLNGDYPAGTSHSAYIAQLTADVATLQAAGLEVIGWGVVDGNTASDLAATGVTGWMPQVEGPGQLSALMSALSSGVGAGLPKAVQTNVLQTPSEVSALQAAGITAVAPYVYSENNPHTEQLFATYGDAGWDPQQTMPIYATYHGEMPTDYTGLDENVIPNYGIYNAPQTSDAQWAEWGKLNGGTLMLSKPLIDVADPATGTGVHFFSIGGGPNETAGLTSGGTFEGFVADVALYHNAAAAKTLRGQYVGGGGGSAPPGTPPPPGTEIPPGTIANTQLKPGPDGTRLVTQSGAVVWAPDTLNQMLDVDTAGVADTNVLAYDAASGLWKPATAGAGGGGGSTWYTGSGAPSGSLGVIGDFYLNSANGDYYEKTGASAWTLRGNLKGPTGATGSTGPAGATGPAGSTGAAGTPGEKWFSGNGAPSFASGGSPPAFVAERYNLVTSPFSASITISPASNCTAGNHLVLCLGSTNDFGTVTSVSDSKGNTWHVDSTQSGKFSAVASCYLGSALSTSDTITITCSGAVNGMMLTINEFSGMATSNWWDLAERADDPSTTTPGFTTSGATAQANELVIGHHFVAGNYSSGTVTPGTGFTLRSICNHSSSVLTSIMQSKTAPATGTQTSRPTLATSTSTSHNHIVTYKAASPGGVENPVGAIVGDWYLDTDTGIWYEKTATTTWTSRGTFMTQTAGDGRYWRSAITPGRITVQSTAPGSPATGDLWIW